MDLNLTGKTVLVTGGSKGIGLGVAKAMAAEGAALHLVSRSADNLAAGKQAIREHYDVEVAVHAHDLSDSGAVDALAAACPKVDVLVNNAGAIPGGDLDAVDEARWREGWDLKVFGYVNMTRRYYRLMREQGHGVIINVVGLAGERPDYGYVAGSAGNAALMAFTRTVGGVSLDHGVRVLGVNPGPVETDRIAALFRTKAKSEFGDEERWRDYFKALPKGRPATVEEVADVVAFLASERAAYMSGIIVTVDGGAAARPAGS
jgi:hypothetical protein